MKKMDDIDSIMKKFSPILKRNLNTLHKYLKKRSDYLSKDFALLRPTKKVDNSIVNISFVTYWNDGKIDEITAKQLNELEFNRGNRNYFGVIVNDDCKIIEDTKCDIFIIMGVNKFIKGEFGDII